MNQLNWWDQLLVDASNKATEVWNLWAGLPSDHRAAIGFGAITLCSFLLVFAYRLRLRKARLQIANLEAGNRLAQQCIHDLTNAANPLHPYGSGIVDDDDQEYGDTIEFDGGLKEEFVLEVIGRVQSMHNETLEVLKELAKDNSHRVDEVLDIVKDTNQRLLSCVETMMAPDEHEET